VRLASIPITLAAAVSLLAATHAFTPYASVKSILDAQRDRLPADLQNPDAVKWTAWAQRHDQAIRARLQQGDLDSMVNLLLLGTSFTKQPRINVENLTEASKSGTLRARVDDLAAGLRHPGDNERLIFLSGLLRTKGIDPGVPGQTGVFLYNNLQRVLQERRTIAERAAEAKPESLLDRASLFSDRGVSLDTSILPDFSIEQTLRDLKQRGMLREGQVARVAVTSSIRTKNPATTTIHSRPYSPLRYTTRCCGRKSREPTPFPCRFSTSAKECSIISGVPANAPRRTPATSSSCRAMSHVRGLRR
jgi:hypothetical protein